MDSIVQNLQPACEQDTSKNESIIITTVCKFDSGPPDVASTTIPHHTGQQDVEKGLVRDNVQPTSSATPEQSRTTHRPNLKALADQCHNQISHLGSAAVSVYGQLWLIIVSANLAAIIFVVDRNADSNVLPLAACANAAVANLTAAILIRQDYMKNLIYHACWSVPHSAPLWLRRRLAKVYENGGVHSGAAVSALMWFAVFTGFLWTDFARGGFSDAAVLTFDCFLAVVLLSIVVAALPQVRRRYHNVFENFHRWAGWSGIGLFWIALVLFARDEAQISGNGTSLGLSLVKLPAFWMLIIISLHAIYPWVLLRKVAVVRTDRLSDHAIRVYFSPKEKISPLHGMAISDAPLHEWHGFAAIPDLDGSDGGATSCIISKVGDWTSKTIETPAPYYYMRGIHSTGVLAMAQIFRSVVIMATGSGIGPCMAAFNQMPNTKFRIIWSTPSPRAIFGDKIRDAVLKQDPQAVIWDTRKDGRRPDLVQMSYEMYHDAGAEAVFFISNRSLTRKVVGTLRQRGVAAFAPVFDS